MLTRTLLLSAAAVTLMSGAALANDPATENPVVKKEETKITTKTYTQVQDLPDVKEVKFSVFDTNNDGKYSMKEVGERLFESFDRDGNGNIDNIEWNTRSVMTITPIEQETFEFVDYGNDGITDVTTYSYNTFYEESGLMRFDDNKNGLSAKEFIKAEYQALDADQDNLISLKEWKAAYEDTYKSSALTKEYNN